jgi:uncharacterized protein YegP (UPF0339 family)
VKKLFYSFSINVYVIIIIANVKVMIKKEDFEMSAKFELYKDSKGEYRWRLVASNGQSIANGGEGYKSKESAKAGIESVKKNAPEAPIEEK